MQQERQVSFLNKSESCVVYKYFEGTYYTLEHLLGYIICLEAKFFTVSILSMTMHITACYC